MRACGRAQIGLTSAGTLRLATNRFSGTIPSQLGQLTNLYALTLDGNPLTGAVPTHLAGISPSAAAAAGSQRAAAPARADSPPGDCDRRRGM